MCAVRIQAVWVHTLSLIWLRMIQAGDISGLKTSQERYRAHACLFLFLSSSLTHPSSDSDRQTHLTRFDWCGKWRWSPPPSLSTIRSLAGISCARTAHISDVRLFKRETTVLLRWEIKECSLTKGASCINTSCFMSSATCGQFLLLTSRLCVRHISTE